jgi:hypothetical protein
MCWGYRKARTSFLKNRSKKLFSASGGTGLAGLGRVLRETDKSFLVLFFQKRTSFLACAQALTGAS